MMVLAWTQGGSCSRTLRSTNRYPTDDAAVQADPREKRSLRPIVARQPQGGPEAVLQRPSARREPAPFVVHTTSEPRSAQPGLVGFSVISDSPPPSRQRLAARRAKGLSEPTLLSPHLTFRSAHP